VCLNRAAVGNARKQLTIPNCCRWVTVTLICHAVSQKFLLLKIIFLILFFSAAISTAICKLIQTKFFLDTSCNKHRIERKASSACAGNVDLFGRLKISACTSMARKGGRKSISTKNGGLLLF
jgi:hypothetical protein